MYILINNSQTERSTGNSISMHVNFSYYFIFYFMKKKKYDISQSLKTYTNRLVCKSTNKREIYMYILIYKKQIQQMHLRTFTLKFS